ncbi:nucleotide exchange factor GrpE [Lachnospiraceae bacterium 54-53]
MKPDEKLADETVKTEDAVSAEKEIEGAEACAEDVTGETVPGGDDAQPDEDGPGAEEDSKAGEGSRQETEKKSFFGKKKEKKDPRDEKIEELTDRLQRNMAEFDNFRKRTEKEKSAMFEIGARDIIERILPVVDNFERGLAAIPEEEKGAPFAEGMDKIYRQLMKTLEEAGVKPIEAMGQPFDPNFHNAVMHIEDESLGENVVAQELQKGYTYRDTVVRHSMVQVAN